MFYLVEHKMLGATFKYRTKIKDFNDHQHRYIRVEALLAKWASARVERLFEEFSKIDQQYPGGSDVRRHG